MRKTTPGGSAEELTEDGSCGSTAVSQAPVTSDAIHRPVAEVDPGTIATTGPQPHPPRRPVFGIDTDRAMLYIV